MWRCRASYRDAPEHDIPLNGVEGGNLSKDQEELLESRWGGFVRTSGVPSRQMYGLQIQREIDMLEDSLKERRWGILVLAEGELLVPDYPGRLFIPLTPTLCFAWGHETGTITGADARLLNRTSMAGCKDYWFCRATHGYGLDAG